MSKVQQTQEDRPMMRGSYGGRDYLPIARKGKWVLGMKLAEIGDSYMVKGATEFAIRFRVALEGTVVPSLPEAETSVVSFNAVKAQAIDVPAQAWELDYTKKGNERASAMYVLLMKGSLKLADKDLWGKVGEGKLGELVAEHAVKLAGGENLVLSQREIAAWVNGKYEPTIEHFRQHLERLQKAEELMAGSVGAFVSVASLQQTIHGVEAQPVEDATDDEQAEAEVQDIEGDQD
jgi:hypothetical protein